MTDTPLDDIVVPGQRARGPSPFSGLSWPTRGGGGGDHQNELDPDDPGGARAPSDESRQ